MNAAQLKESIEKASKVKRPTLEKLFYFVTLGDELRPEYKDFAAGANTYKEFFDELYACDDFKNTEVWAEWAKLEHKNWLNRFEPQININNMRLKSAGIPVEFSSGILLLLLQAKTRLSIFMSILQIRLIQMLQNS